MSKKPCNTVSVARLLFCYVTDIVYLCRRIGLFFMIIV